MAIGKFNDIEPKLESGAWVHESAQVIGEISIGENSSVWPNVAARGDVNFIRIGKESNIQDNSTLHVTHKSESDPAGAPLIIGDRVTVGHAVILHGCTIGNDCLIGMGAIVLDRAVIEDRVMVGAGSLVPPGKVLRSGYLYVGSPVKEIRPLSEGELAGFAYSANNYVKLMKQYRDA
ncbi:Carbonic anhydrase or acetyltransferase, isoleucine patch superfamily [Formivibrio citricus]|uniref:Carbonic anhydrase or acetyltransferase, isoleucine patch superfamily n=1 Tax=Formivibrio citricus TaxID=83765 RepID=A0A1I5A7E7_9NEIS|nr:gamma carbonic anhydrase family protein [Formivibrio citricus]SFN58367.1 Carbonic anhydrase or acetyltransferase, isoleucine patch superfamily [Formivibrio citricus]